MAGVLVLLIAGVAIAILMKTRKQNKNVTSVDNERPESNEDGNYLYADSVALEAPLPSHVTLQKDANLKEKSKEASSQEEVLEDEFYNMVNYVQENVKREMKIASQGNNTVHNRYIDIGKLAFQLLSI